MTFEEYFGDWLKVIDQKELNKVITALNSLYKVKHLTPSYENVFKAFTLCSEHDCKIIFIGQDFNRLPISNLIYLLHI